MKNNTRIIKKKLDDSISQLCDVSWMFSSNPEKDFSRNRKLPLKKIISILLSMQGGTLTNELLRYFNCSLNTASSSAFVQQRSKLNSYAFPTLFDFFVKKTDTNKLYKGFHLLAADGSDFKIHSNPKHTSSHYPSRNGQAPYNILHLDAVYDLLEHTYKDVTIVGDREANEQRNLCHMVDRSNIQKAIVIADRGYENYNLMAHIQEKGWKYIIRIKDIHSLGGIASGLKLPDFPEFDAFIDLSLTTKQTNEIKNLCKSQNEYRFINTSANFDFLPKTNRKFRSAKFYKLPFRIVRFKITDNAYETVVTNLDSKDFSDLELKKLYAMRWGIETSFRELKYTVGLLHFHSKKVEYIYQEIYAKLIMYNFTELITSHVIVQKLNTKYVYKANFTVAVHLCRQLFLGNISPPDLEALIRKNVSPVRPGRSRPRNLTTKYAISFLYRVA